jgi:polysaccharide export outer membrane protein
MSRVTLLRGLCCTLLLLAGGCEFLPRSGPSTSEVEDRFKDPKNNPLGVQEVDLSPATVAALGQAPVSSLSAIDRLNTNKPVDRVGPGDVLAVSIYEAGPGLFSNLQRPTTSGDTGTTAEALPRQQVDRLGRIEIPFAGMISVAGLTTTEIQQTIQDRLAGKASSPQVIVTVVSGDTNSVIVSGDVKNPGRRPLTLAGETLLDVIALSGGPSHDPYDTTVRVERGGVSASVPLTSVQDNTRENIRMAPQDRVQVSFDARTFLVFGATGRVSQTPFDTPRLTLAEAMARSGGLDDNRADPSSIYLFRMEPPVVGDLLKLPPRPSATPVIYHADLRDPQNFFLMKEFFIRNKDLLYVANARSVQFYKFLQLIYTVVTPAVTGRQLSQ